MAKCQISFFAVLLKFFDFKENMKCQGIRKGFFSKVFYILNLIFSISQYTQSKAFITLNFFFQGDKPLRHWSFLRCLLFYLSLTAVYVEVTKISKVLNKY